MNERDRRLVILGMHAAWMSLPHALRNAERILDAQELSRAMSAYVQLIARHWELPPLGFPTMDELNAVLDEIEKLPTPPRMPAVARRPENNN
jgi:hypothetical protein